MGSQRGSAAAQPTSMGIWGPSPMQGSRVRAAEKERGARFALGVGISGDQAVGDSLLQAKSNCFVITPAWGVCSYLCLQ